MLQSRRGRPPKAQRLNLEVTPAQLQTLTALQKVFGEKGYHICPVAGWYRGHWSDFIAIPKPGIVAYFGNLVVVAPAKDGRVWIRPYTMIGKDAAAEWVALHKRHFTAPVKWHKDTLPTLTARRGWWLAYVPLECREQLRKLGFDTTIPGPPRRFPKERHRPNQ